MYHIFFICTSAAATAKSLQSCLTLCDPIDGSPRGSPIPGILQARTLEWVAISFSNAWKWKVKVKLLSRVRLLATPWTTDHQALRPWDFPGKSTGVGCHCLLRSIPLLVDNLGYFLVLAVVNSAAMNIEVHIYFQIMFLSECVPRSEISGSYGRSLF